MQVEPLNEPDLAASMLRMFPKKWESEYKLQHRMPQTVRQLLEAVEKIEVARPLEDPNKNKTRTNTGDVSNRDKRKSGSTYSERIPKKSRREVRFCKLCKTHGGAHDTHNTKDCNKYDQSGNLKRGFKSKAHSGKNIPTPSGQAYAQILLKVAKLEKAQRKLKKRKRRHSSDSSDSDSS
jgi:hypothetical protein